MRRELRKSPPIQRAGRMARLRPPGMDAVPAVKANAAQDPDAARETVALAATASGVPDADLDLAVMPATVVVRRRGET